MFKKIITIFVIHFLFVALEYGFHYYCIGGSENFTRSILYSLNAHSNVVCRATRYISIKISDTFSNIIIIVLSFIIEKLISVL